MNFLHDKHSRYYCIFIVTLVLLLFLMGIAVIDTQTAATKEMFLTHNNAIATSLLEEGISKEVIATALMNTEAGTTGNKFLAEIGLSNSTDIENLPYVSAVKNTILTSLFVMLFLWTLLLFLGTMLFLYRRERLYRESENIIKDYIDGNYTVHLPQSNEGTIYQLLSSVDQLATMLQAKNDTEQKTKEFLKNTISDISHQLKTPLSALMMYQEIIENEPENFETVKEFSLKIGTALKRMEQLIQSMLKITRIDAGSISFEKSNYSIGIQNISDEDAMLISSRPEVATVADYGTLNFRGEQEYTLHGKNVSICGGNESIVTEIFNVLDEGTFPKTENEAMISINAKDTLKLKIGEQIVITTPNGTEFSYIISGFMKNSANLMREDVYGVFLTTDGFRTIYSNETDVNPSEYTMFFVLFDNKGNIPKEIAEIKEQYELSDKQVTENITLLGLMGQSDDSFMAQVYTVAIILFFLVLMAGVLMIASSMNTNVAQRTEFFGMVRCIGATPKQVMQLVRKEVMNWCRFAIPLGVIGGMVLVWVLCFILRQLSPQYFGGMPAFSISYPSIIAGIVVGLLTVLLAARSPAKKASKVSPLAAVSGNANDLQPVKKAANTKFFKIDTSLGIHHAKASKKNFILMISSFSISIILFLAFSVTIDFMNHTLTPLQPWTADISVISPEDTCSVKAEFIEELQQNPAVKNVYGRMFAYNVPVIVNGEEKVVDLISYEDMQFDWAKDYVLSGSLEKAQSESNTGLIVFEPQNDIEVGNVITLNLNGSQADMEIVGMLSDCPFNNRQDVGKLICSEDTFRKLTGETDYSIIDIQLSQNATENDVNEIHRLVGSQYTFSDCMIRLSSWKNGLKMQS